MDNQLALLPKVDVEDEPSWALDDHTRDIGRQGLAAAREALRDACARRAA